ncbi:hypothetical protein CR513_48120, partial [Mucuna pruriens]
KDVTNKTKIELQQAMQRQEAVEIRHRKEKEHHQETLRLAGKRETELRRQLERIRVSIGPTKPTAPSSHWGQSFRKEIN